MAAAIWRQPIAVCRVRRTREVSPLVLRSIALAIEPVGADRVNRLEVDVYS